MITVTNTNDAGAGSLRQAIADATPGEEITFSVTGTITLTTGELLIAQNQTITGPGFLSLTIDGNAASRIFNTDTGVISISGMTLINGADSEGAAIHNEATLTLDDMLITDCVSSDDGGGIWNSSTITKTDCVVVDCTASAGDGGGIHNTGTITATDLAVSGCTSVGNGGGVFNDGTFTHNGGSITGNTASNPGVGGGVFSVGTYTTTAVTIANNTAPGDGGGVHNEFGTVGITDCVIHTNDPIGLKTETGTVTIDNSTISTNVNSGIVSDLGAVAIRNSTIVLHTFGVSQTNGSILELFDTILAGNTTDYDGETADCISGGHNILGVNSNPITPAAGDQTILTYAALILGALQDNGGPTFTHALLTGSPAIDAGDNTGAPTYDQRGAGFPRVNDGTIDVGAYEFEEDVPPDPPNPPPPLCSPETLLADGIANFCCLSPDQVRTVKLGLLKNWVLANNEDADVTPESLLEAGTIFGMLSKQQQRAVKLQLLCELL